MPEDPNMQLLAEEYLAKSMGDEFNEWLSIVYKSGLSEEQKKELRMCWFCSAWIVSNKLKVLKHAGKPAAKEWARAFLAETASGIEKLTEEPKPQAEKN